MIVGKPSMAYFSWSFSFCSFNSLGSSLFCGKSNSRRTKCLGETALKPSVVKTSFCSLMHQPHQSEPVKSIRMSLLSFAAAVFASSKFVTQPSPARTAGEKVRQSAGTLAAKARHKVEKSCINVIKVGLFDMERLCRFICLNTMLKRNCHGRWFPVHSEFA